MKAISINNILIVTAATVLFQFAGAAQAQDSLNALVQEISAEGAKEQELFNTRVETFRATTPAEQKKMLADAEAKLQSLTSKSDVLVKQLSENEVKLTELDKSVRDKATALGLAEVFGLSRQVAGDLAMSLQQSLISTQFAPGAGEPTRADGLRAFASSKQAPTIVDIEKLWFEMQREMVATGQVAKYTTTIVQPSGEPVESTVVRIGPFTSLSDGKFLAYKPDMQSLQVYPRQPPGEILQYAKALESTSDGYVQAVVDSAQGVLMSLYVERPTWLQRIQNGEYINYVILTVGGVAFIAFVLQVIYLVGVRLKVNTQLKNLNTPKNNNPLGRVLLAVNDKGKDTDIEQDADVAELRISEAVSREIPKLERVQALLRLAVAAGPLLGLIGTVLGMILTFQSITESGSSDPKLMAEGIGAAMIATVLGLGIAIPLLFGNALLKSVSVSITQILEEQSAGILAEKIEKIRHA